jgi:hypothetical protein
MYLFLLIFGSVLSVAGVILTASGLSVHDHTFDASLVTPGIVAVVGGLLLIGLGYALRVLQRIEFALETRPAMPRAVRAAATPEPTTAGAAEPKTEPSRIPFPTRVARPPQAATAPLAEKRADELPLKFPSIARPAPAPAFEDETSPKLPLPLADEAEEPAAENTGLFASRGLKARNGAAPPPRVSPRLDPSARAPLKVQRPIGPAFDALWPKGPRRAAAQAASAPAPETAEPVAERQLEDQIREQVQARLQEPVRDGVHELASRPAHAPAAEEEAVDTVREERTVAASPAVAPEAEPEQNPEPVTVLKSGIVDGMAYTLYSDGSIEAQLPQGLLRFGSISELRAHIEQDTPRS